MQEISQAVYMDGKAVEAAVDDILKPDGGEHVGIQVLKAWKV